MHSTIASELWDEFKRFIGNADREEAADIMINVLINNDEDLEDIRTAFAHDTDVRRALTAYSDQDDADQSDYDEDSDDEDQW